MNLMDTDVCIQGPNQCKYALVSRQSTTGMCCLGLSIPSTWTAAPAGSCSVTCLDGNACGGPATSTLTEFTYTLSAYVYHGTVLIITYLMFNGCFRY